MNISGMNAFLSLGSSATHTHTNTNIYICVSAWVVE